MRSTGAYTSADLGSSSDYSNELQIIGRALKAVVEKVSLRVALSQGLVGPKDQVNSEYKSEMVLIRKGIRLIFRNF